MNKVYITLALILSVLSSNMQAQEAATSSNLNAIGIRIPGGFWGSGYGVEISYQRKMKANNRLELDFGTYSVNKGRAIGLTGIYQWVRNLKGGLNWYYGPAAALKYINRNNNSDKFDIGIGGQIGLEYDFNFINAPLNASLDFRPVFLLGSGGTYNDFGFALGVRYTF